MNEDWVEIPGIIISETDFSILFEVDDFKARLPKQRIDYDARVGIGKEVEVSMPLWLATSKELV